MDLSPARGGGDRAPAMWDPVPGTDRRAITTTLVLTFALAVAFRVVLFFSRLVDITYETSDSWQYLDLARSLLTGAYAEHGLPSMNRSPGYPAFLAAVFAILGDTQLAVTGAQIVIDALTCTMAVHLAFRLGLRHSSAVVVAVLAATCVFSAVFSYEVMTETLYCFALTASLWIVVRGRDEGGGGLYGRTTGVRMLLSGLALGFAILVRPALAPSALLFASWIFVHDLVKRPWPRLSARVIRMPALFSAGVSLMVLPWMIRNFVTFHDEFVGPNQTQVTLLGRKSCIPNHEHFFSKEGRALLFSYEEPFVQIGAFNPPSLARFVYPGEKEELDAAYAQLKSRFDRHDGYNGTESLRPFAEITEKRYRAAPRLYLTAPLTRMFKLWITPRIALVWDHHAGHNSPPFLVAAMTLYSAVYVLFGMFGLWWGLRGRSAVSAIFIASMIAGHTFAYALWHPFPQSRYCVALFPLLGLAAGALLQHILDRRRARRTALASALAPQAHR